MKKSTLLKRAKEYLWDGVDKKTDGKTPFVCYAVALAASSGRCRSPSSDEARIIVDWIQIDILDGYCALPVWLRAVREIRCDPLARDDITRLQATRLAWLNWMIDYWQSKGE